jgi:hypothetical protein
MSLRDRVQANRYFYLAYRMGPARSKVKSIHNSPTIHPGGDSVSPPGWPYFSPLWAEAEDYSTIPIGSLKTGPTIRVGFCRPCDQVSLKQSPQPLFGPRCTH